MAIATTTNRQLFDFKAGIRTKVATDDVHDTTPTNAQLITAFGAAATQGAGFIGVVNDAAGGTNFYLVATDGVTYFWTKMTKAL